MNRWAVAFIGLVFSLSISTKSTPLTKPAGFVFEGRITSQDGSAVPGAEVRIADSSGKAGNGVLSDLQGFYRFPWMLIPIEQAAGYRMEVSHLRFQTVRLDDVLSAARTGWPAPTNLAPHGRMPVLASTSTVRRDFVLTSNRTPLGPIDPSRAESVYQEGLLNLNRNPKQALEQLKAYAQTGQNMKQVGRALTLITEYSK